MLDFGIFLKGLGIENFGLLNGHLVYCLVRIFPFWYVLPKKSGNPAKNAKN
jgi:hypothetical protein